MACSAGAACGCEKRVVELVSSSRQVASAPCRPISNPEPSKVGLPVFLKRGAAVTLLHGRRIVRTADLMEGTTLLITE
jgi:hypothetical protein